MITIQLWKSWNKDTQKKITEDYCFDVGIDCEDRKKLSDNITLLTNFSIEAHRVAKHREHYSARTIIEVLRHNSLIEDNDPDYKIDNNITPLMARISMAMFPALNGLFETRILTSKVN